MKLSIALKEGNFESLSFKKKMSVIKTVLKEFDNYDEDEIGDMDETLIHIAELFSFDVDGDVIEDVHVDEDLLIV